MLRQMPHKPPAVSYHPSAGAFPLSASFARAAHIPIHPRRTASLVVRVFQPRTPHRKRPCMAPNAAAGLSPQTWSGPLPNKSGVGEAGLLNRPILKPSVVAWFPDHAAPPTAGLPSSMRSLRSCGFISVFSATPLPSCFCPDNLRSFPSHWPRIFMYLDSEFNPAVYFAAGRYVIRQNRLSLPVRFRRDPVRLNPRFNHILLD